MGVLGCATCVSFMVMSRCALSGADELIAADECATPSR